jgi:hypothetical protein
MKSNSCSGEYSWLATKWETPRGIWPCSISWLSEGIGKVALDHENIAAITRRKEVYLYFSTFAYNRSRNLSIVPRRFALGRPLPARSDTNPHAVSTSWHGSRTPSSAVLEGVSGLTESLVDIATITNIFLKMIARSKDPRDAEPGIYSRPPLTTGLYERPQRGSNKTPTTPRGP